MECLRDQAEALVRCQMFLGFLDCDRGKKVAHVGVTCGSEDHQAQDLRESTWTG